MTSEGSKSGVKGLSVDIDLRNLKRNLEKHEKSESFSLTCR